MSSQTAAEQQPPHSSASNDNGDVQPRQDSASKNDKDKKRRFFGLGKRKDGQQAPQSTVTEPEAEDLTDSASAPIAPVPALSTAPLEIPRAPRSPPQPLSLSAAASPARSGRLRSSSPRMHSPDSSSIFERNVQDSTLPDDVAKDLAIPAHIQTEDHIPPALEASTIAITDDHLGPDEVKIVTHAAHQPAAEKVVGGTQTPAASEAGLSPIGGLSPIEDPGINIHQSLETSQTLGGSYQPSSLAQSGVFSAVDDGASSYAGAADAADVRRLSFISFADVVQSEHAESSRDSTLHSALSLSAANINRSPSPVLSSQGLGISPQTSGAPSMKGVEANKGYALPPASPARGPGVAREGGEIVVETMRQALRRTGSGDLRNTASSPLEAKGQEELALR